MGDQVLRQTVAKWFLGETGRISFIKLAIMFEGAYWIIKGFPDAAAMEGLQIVLPSAVVMIGFICKYLGYIFAGIGGRDLIGKFSKK